MKLLTVDDRRPAHPNRPGQRTPDARRPLRRQRLHRPGCRGLPARSQMVASLQSNRPLGSTEPDGRRGLHLQGRDRVGHGAEESARRLTLSLAGRARNVAPVLAEKYPLDGARLLVDVGGGSGSIRSPGCSRNPGLQAIVWDRPEVLKVASEDGRGSRRLRPPRMPAGRHVSRPAAWRGRRHLALEHPARLGCRRVPLIDLASVPRHCRLAASS